MNVRGWSPTKHIARDILLALLAIGITAVAQLFYRPQPCPFESNVATWPTALLAIGGLSGAMTGSSIIATTVIIGWWDTGRLSNITSVPVFADTMLLLLKANTWILGSLTLISIIMAVIPVSPTVHIVTTSIYGGLAITSVNYLRRTITMLYLAARLVTVRER